MLYYNERGLQLDMLVFLLVYYVSSNRDKRDRVESVATQSVQAKSDHQFLYLHFDYQD